MNVVVRSYVAAVIIEKPRGVAVNKKKKLCREKINVDRLTLNIEYLQNRSNLNVVLCIIYLFIFFYHKHRNNNWNCWECGRKGVIYLVFFFHIHFEFVVRNIEYTTLTINESTFIRTIQSRSDRTTKKRKNRTRILIAIIFQYIKLKIWIHFLFCFIICDFEYDMTLQLLVDLIAIQVIISILNVIYIYTHWIHTNNIRTSEYIAFIKSIKKKIWNETK